MEKLDQRELRKHAPVTLAERLLTIGMVVEITTLPKPSIYRKIAEGDFPSPIRIGERRSAWWLSDILNWIDSRARGCGAAVARKAAQHGRLETTIRSAAKASCDVRNGARIGSRYASDRAKRAFGANMQLKIRA